MASGRQLGVENLATFQTWAASKTNQDFRAMTIRGALSRTEIAKECGFAKSALIQNPAIRDALAELELGLRGAGVLPLLVKDEEAPTATLPIRPQAPASKAADAERLNRLEQENALLRTEVSELKRQLSRFAILSEALADSGRIPR